MWVNLYAEYSPYIGSLTLNTSTVNPFIYVAPINPSPSKTASLGLILGLVGGGVGLILIGVGVYCYFKKCRNAQQESDALQAVYQTDPAQGGNTAALLGS